MKKCDKTIHSHGPFPAFAARAEFVLQKLFEGWDGTIASWTCSNNTRLGHLLMIIPFVTDSCKALLGKTVTIIGFWLLILLVDDVKIVCYVSDLTRVLAAKYWRVYGAKKVSLGRRMQAFDALWGHSPYCPSQRYACSRPWTKELIKWPLDIKQGISNSVKNWEQEARILST